MNKVETLTEDNPMYNDIMEEIKNVSDDALVIVAKSYKNRKDDAVRPIAIKNGIYFYVAYGLDEKIAYINKATPEQIYKAKANMCRRAKVGSMIDVLFKDDCSTLDEFEFKGDPMTLVTLDCKMYGGGLLCCEEFMREMKRKIGQYYVLPSSIHEIIFVPANEVSKNDLINMVKEVNKELVSEDVYLADVAFEVNDWIE